MSSVWVLHRDESLRDALASDLRYADGPELQVGDPTHAAWESAAAPAVVVLGVAGDFEAELEFAYRRSRQAPTTQWLLVAEPGDVEEVERLFDAIAGEVLPLDGTAEPLRERLSQRVRRLIAQRASPPLSERSRRERLTQRFTDALADLELPALLLATDPRRVAVPLLIRGETGSGRGLLARYLHQLATGVPAGPFVAIPCGGIADRAELETSWIVETGRLPSGRLVTVCLEDLDRLARPLQRVVAGWIEDGAPGFIRSASLRWMGTASDDPGILHPELERVLAEIEITLPPLRERRETIPLLVERIARRWCERRQQGPRSFAPDALDTLAARPWPGNLRELETTVTRCLARSSANPVPSRDVAHWIEEAEDILEAEVETEAPAAAGEVLEAELFTDAEPAGAESAPAAAPQIPAVPRFPATAAGTLRRFAGSLTHELGNPLVGIRSFAQMLPRRFDDAEFRTQAAERVADDTSRIEGVLETLGRVASLGTPELAPVDLSSLLAGLVAERRGAIEARRWVVLEELDREGGRVLADREQLRFGLATLLDSLLELVPARGDLYVATRRHPGDATAPATAPAGVETVGSVRTLIRFSAGESPPPAGGLTRIEQNLGLSVLEAVIDAQGGSFALDLAELPAAMILFELPAV